MKSLDLLTTAGDEGERLDKFIARAGKIARGEARRVLDRGGVWVDGKRVKAASRPLRAGQKVSVFLEEGGRSAPAMAQLDRRRIVYEDAGLIAVDKPPFVAAQATLSSDKGSLLDLVSDYLKRPAGLVHRLDLETSGLTLFAKNRAMTSALAEAFRTGQVHKQYLAVAWGELPATGRTDAPLKPDPRRRGRFITREGGTPAATAFQVLAKCGLLQAVRVEPETGRTHQIRVHLKGLGAPLVGDSLYGGPREVPGPAGFVAAKRVMLHARSVRLTHPATGAPLELSAPVPTDLLQMLTLAGVDPQSL